MLFLDSQGKKILLSEERWKHINERHPETRLQEQIISHTLAEPDYIQEGNKGERLTIKKFSKTPISENKYCIVVSRDVDLNKGFIITAYFTRRPSFKRKLLWKK